MILITGKQSRVASTIAEVAGKTPTTFDEFAREYAPYLRGTGRAFTVEPLIGSK